MDPENAAIAAEANAANRAAVTRAANQRAERDWRERAGALGYDRTWRVALLMGEQEIDVFDLSTPDHPGGTWAWQAASAPAPSWEAFQPAPRLDGAPPSVQQVAASLLMLNGTYCAPHLLRLYQHEGTVVRDGFGVRFDLPSRPDI